MLRLVVQVAPTSGIFFDLLCIFAVRLANTRQGEERETNKKIRKKRGERKEDWRHTHKQTHNTLGDAKENIRKFPFGTPCIWTKTVNLNIEAFPSFYIFSAQLVV